MKLNILILGMRGIGVEIIYNVALADSKSVTLFDPNLSKINNLTYIFYLTKENIVKNRKRV